MSNKIDMLYHYCPVEALFGILDSETLWFSDLTKSNDPYECELLFRAFLKYCRTNDIDINERSANFLRKGIEENTHVYGACFTDEENKLVHWSSYAKNDGVCIAFDYDYLTKLFNSIELVTDSSWKKFQKVWYGANNKYAIKIFDEIASNKKEKTLYYISKLIECEALFKTDFWSNESEHRMCFRVLSDETSVPLVQVDKKPCKKAYSERNGKVIFRYEIPISVNEIKEIIVGPNSSIDSCTLKEMLFARYGDRLNNGLVVSDCFESYKTTLASDDDETNLTNK